MDKEKPSGLPPPHPPGRYSAFSPNAMKPESSFPHITPSGSSSDANLFSHDISRMSDNPPKNLGHRRAHSEILTLPDDLSFDFDLGVVGGSADVPSFSDDTEGGDLMSMYLDMDKFNSSTATSSAQVGEPSRTAWKNESVMPQNSFGERPRVRHQHSHSMDGSLNISEMLVSGNQ